MTDRQLVIDGVTISLPPGARMTVLLITQPDEVPPEVVAEIEAAVEEFNPDKGD